MYGIFPPRFTIRKSTIHVGKYIYISFLNGMGQTSIFTETKKIFGPPPSKHSGINQTLGNKIGCHRQVGWKPIRAEKAKHHSYLSFAPGPAIKTIPAEMLELFALFFAWWEQSVSNDPAISRRIIHSYICGTVVPWYSSVFVGEDISSFDLMFKLRGGPIFEAIFTAVSKKIRTCTT